jgi:N-acetylglucosamine kinase-like BadF-type ATPase
MTSYYLGVDIGSTKTHALIADATGRAVGFGHAGPGNHEAIGYAGMAETLRVVSARALAVAGLSIDQIAGAGFGISGFDWLSQRAPMLETIAEAIGLRAPTEVVNDAVLGLVAGTAAGWGVALVGGTGSNCRGRDRAGREGRVTGEGYLFGEGGGSGELVRDAFRAVSRAWSRRGPATRLADVLVAYAGALHVDDLLEGVSLGRYSLRPAAAPLIFEAARGGDRVAQGVIRSAGRALGDLAVGVIRQLDFEHAEFDVVLVGSLFNGGPLFTRAVRDTVRLVAPGARFKRLAAPPVTGAVLLGMQQAGLDIVAPRRALLRTPAELTTKDDRR